LVRIDRARSQSVKLGLKVELKNIQQRMIQKEPLSLENFSLIAEWYYLALLELVTLKDYQDDRKKIAAQFGLSEEEIKRAMETLIKVGLVKFVDGKFLRTKDHLSLGDVSSGVIRNYHKSLLVKAADAIEVQPPNHRHFWAAPSPCQ